MKAVLGWAFLLAISEGCVVEDEGHGHHQREVVQVESGHVHDPGCGHVLIGGIWYEEK